MKGQLYPKAILDQGKETSKKRNKAPLEGNNVSRSTVSPHLLFICLVLLWESEN